MRFSIYKLLIVDDEPLVQVGIKSMLNWNELNIEVAGTAVNGQIALKMIEELNPDIVITDIKGHNGCFHKKFLSICNIFQI